jgi:hypothetical protein
MPGVYVGVKEVILEKVPLLALQVTDAAFPNNVAFKLIVPPEQTELSIPKSTAANVPTLILSAGLLMALVPQAFCAATWKLLFPPATDPVAVNVIIAVPFPLVMFHPVGTFHT